MKKTIFGMLLCLTLVSQSNADVNVVLTADTNDTRYPVAFYLASSRGDPINATLDSLKEHNQTVALTDGDWALVVFSSQNRPVFSLEAEVSQNSLNLSLYDGSDTKIANSTTPLSSDFVSKIVIPVGVTTQSVNKRSIVRPSDVTIKAIKTPMISAQSNVTDNNVADNTDSLEDEFEWIEKNYR